MPHGPYTLVDSEGIQHANPLTYLEVSMATPAILYAAGVAAAKGLPSLRAEVNGATFVAGLGRSPLG